MRSVRKQLLLSYLVLFLLFVSLMVFQEIEIGLIALGAAAFFLYGLITWAILHRYVKPIRTIVRTILPYHEGKEEFLPAIAIGREIQEESEFGKLAHTLNSLSARVQKQIESLRGQRKEIEAILQTLGEGVVAVDSEGHISFANEVACRMLGVCRQAILSFSLDEVESKRQGLIRHCYELVKKVFERSESIAETFTVEGEQKIYFHLIAAPLAQYSGFLLVLQDKTSDYKVIEMGKDFIANASHELRTPITVIRGFTETLYDHPDLSKEQIKESLEKIFRTSLRLESLIKSLLHLADVDHMGEEPFGPKELGAIAEACRSLIQTAHPEISIAIHKRSDPMWVAADSNLLEMAIMNLLQNAVKYSPAPAQIQMILESKESVCQLKVKDRGIGIPEAELSHIFDRFYTVDKARARKSGGAGLGLSIVKTIVQKHRVSIEVVSQLGEGSVFTIALPKRIVS